MLRLGFVLVASLHIGLARRVTQTAVDAAAQDAVDFGDARVFELLGRAVLNPIGHRPVVSELLRIRNAELPADFPCQKISDLCVL
jgi:hypothetical protein